MNQSQIGTLFNLGELLLILICIILTAFMKDSILISSQILSQNMCPKCLKLHFTAHIFYKINFLSACT